MSVPDIGGLLGKISEKRDELPKTERQHVVTAPVAEKQENVKTENQLNDKSFSQKNVKTEKQENKKTGRPSLKVGDKSEYVRLGCNIHQSLRKKAGHAITDGLFKTPEGKTIKTLDELVSLALTQLLR